MTINSVCYYELKQCQEKMSAGALLLQPTLLKHSSIYTLRYSIICNALSPDYYQFGPLKDN
jgi:hypothetical protein